MISDKDYEVILQSTITRKTSRHEKIDYIDYAFSFDTETSSFYEKEEKRCCMYAWGFGYGGKVFIGRTWGEFIELYEEIVAKLQLNFKKRIVVYVHNLSYDFQFARKWLPFKEVFSVKEREPLYAITEHGVEFRDSLLLSGLSLEKTAETLTSHTVKKLVGNLDYDLIRHPETPMSEQEISYLRNDCLVVTAYIEEQLQQYKSVGFIPYTKTGKVRKWCRTYIEKHEDKWRYKQLMKNLILDLEEYKLCKQAYTGGFSHANPNHVGKVINNVKSFDFTSSYPAVMCSELYPMSAPEKINIDNIQDLNKKRKYHNIIFNVTFYDLESKIDYEHYISESKCLKILQPVYTDNGRVVYAKGINITITEIDWDIICKCYSFSKVSFGKAIRFKSRPLPRAFLECVYHFYEGKTTLKDIEGVEEEYQNMKEMLNALYGMCVTDIIRDNIVYDTTLNEWTGECANGDTIEEYNDKRNRFLYYPWGVYITAYARRNLWWGIFELENDYLYSDTDSLKIINFEKHATFFEKYNQFIQVKLQKILELTNAKGNFKPLNNKGQEKILGIWEEEKDIKKFKTLGAKRYMCYYGNKEYKITIAGLSKSKGAEYLKKEYKTIDKIFGAFSDQLSVPEEWTNKKVHTYIDREMVGKVTDYLGNIYYYHELSGIHLSGCSFVLSLSEQFKEYLTHINSFKE